MKQDADIDNRNFGVIQKMFVFRKHFPFQYLVNGSQMFDIKPGIPIGPQQRHHQRLNSGVGRTIGIGRHTGIHNIHTGLCCFQQRHGRHTGRKMAVQMNGKGGNGFQFFYNGVSIIRGQEACHIFDTDAVGAHGFKISGFLNIIFQIVDVSTQSGFRDGVADAALKMLAARFDNRHDGFKISVIV